MGKWYFPMTLALVPRSASDNQTRVGSACLPAGKFPE